MKTENIEKAIKEGNIETLIQKIKDMPVYDLYEKAVKDDTEHTEKLLQMTTMLFALIDKEMSAMMTSVSLDLLFAMIDQKLKHEILDDNRGV